MTDKTCAERIAKHLAGREEYLREVFDRTSSEDDFVQDEAHDELHSFGLGLSRKTVFRLDISTGGPADFLEVVCEQERYGYSIERVVYHFADWFDHAEQDVEPSSALYQWAEYVIESQTMDSDQ